MLKANSNITELDLSSNFMRAEQAQILAPAIQDNGALAKFTFSGDRNDSKPVTVEVGMTEADFSGAKLGTSGAIILAAWLQHKVANPQFTSALTQTNYLCMSSRTRGRWHQSVLREIH